VNAVFIMHRTLVTVLKSPQDKTKTTSSPFLDFYYFQKKNIVTKKSSFKSFQKKVITDYTENNSYLSSSLVFSS
jgi:predicted P-loop ATPase